jgi:hypothetical protein
MEKPGKFRDQQPRQRSKYAQGHNTGPLLPVSRAFPCVLVCLHYQGETARKTALAALQQKRMKNRGMIPRFSVFLAALLPLYGLF